LRAAARRGQARRVPRAGEDAAGLTDGLIDVGRIRKLGRSAFAPGAWP
jgi:hypothetical protein